MAQQTRPEPMNASPYHSKVRVSLKFADTQFAAGSAVTGKMELECKAEKGLGIGVIMVELYAIEELTSRDHSATSTFLQSRRLFQGPGLPPSNSVHPYPSPGDPPLPASYYHARRGITTFLFQFPLPESSPSSIDFGSGLARLRYEVRASVGVAWKGEKKLVTDKKAVDVVERLEPDFNRIDPEGVIVGENGKIWMQGKVLGGFMVAGQPSCIELMVKNHSTKKNSGLSVTLTRELYLPSIPPTQKQPLQLSDTVTSVSFRGPEYIIVPGAEGVANLVIDVPKNARGVKGGRRVGDEGRVSECLFEVRCMVSVKLGMGIGSKDIRLDLPVIILHPSVAPDYPPYDMYAIPPEPPAVYDPSMMFYQPPVSPAPYLDRPMSPYAYPVPPMSPPIAPYVDHGQVWLPQPSMSPIPHNAYATAPYYGQMAAPPMTVAPFAIPPPRPSSAEPMPSQPLYNLPAGLPPVTIPPPLLPMPTGGTQPGVREEGKGERASRISHHLRMSSRHRSVSPPAHRYHVPEPAPAPLPPVTLAAIPPAQHASISPGSSPDTRRHPGTTLSLSPLHTGGEVVSPRPMLSPKRSFTNDPFDQVTQVENLERMAAQEDLGGPAIAPGPALSEHNADAREKTLPRPPVPTDKEPVPSSHARADMLFTPSAGGREDDAPPPRTPTLAAVTSLKVPRGLQLGNDSSGLDALEARLLAEVDTRKPEKDGNRPPDVRAVLPIAIPRPGGDIDPPNDSAISSLTLPGLDLDAELDAADEKTLRRGGNISVRAGSDRDVGEAADSTRARDSKETTGARTKGSKETVGRGREREREAKKGISAGMRRERDAKRSEDIDGKDKDRDKDKDKGKDKELHHLRKAAQGRIAAWLGSIDPDVPPPSGTPPPETPPPESLSPPLGSSPLRPTARSPLRSPAVSPARSPAVSPSRSVGRSPGRGPAISPDRSPARSPARSPRLSQAEIPIVASSASTAGQKSKDVGSSDQAAAAQEEAQAAPNPRSSGFVAIGTVRDAPTLRPPTNANGVKHGQKVAAPWDAFLLPKASPRLAVYPPRPPDPEVKYDVRSARGGRGGIVTSVASLWASAAQSPAKEPPKAVLPTTKPQPKPAKLAEQWKAKAGIDYPSSSTPKSEPSKSPALPDARPKALRPTPRTATSSPANIIPSSDPATTSVADLTTRRARMIKSASVPAVVSSSLATPMLSSTASLARPVPAAAERRKLNVKLPPTISETPDVHNQATATTTSASSQGGMKSPPAKAEMAFGQARLRELIKRYQGQVNS